MMPGLALLMLHGGPKKKIRPILWISAVWRCIPGEAATMADWGSEVELPGPENPQSHLSCKSYSETARHKHKAPPPPAQDAARPQLVSGVLNGAPEGSSGRFCAMPQIYSTVSLHGARLRSGGLCLQLARLRLYTMSALRGTSQHCARYHSAVVTSTGDVATFGSKISKCLDPSMAVRSPCSTARLLNDPNDWQ